MNRLARLFTDPRDIQIIFLLLFLTLGVWGRDWTVTVPMAAAAVGSCVIAQFLADRWNRTLQPTLRSALITGISLCLLLRANSPWTVALAGALSIASKFTLRFRGKHFFNPSNFGIILVLLFTGDAWITPGQWGNDLWYALVFLATGGMIVGKVGRWDTTGAFLGCYAALEAVRNYWLGWTSDVLLHRLMSGSLLLFAFFMITDPRAIPDDRRARIVFASLVAALTYVLRNHYFVASAPFWALFVLSPLTIVFDRIRPAGRFVWASPRISQPPVRTQEVLT